MRKPITPDSFDAVIISIASGVMISVCLVFALQLFSLSNSERDRSFSTANFSQVFRAPF
jgi:capsular polysaccharide biosynthesis protein